MLEAMSAAPAPTDSGWRLNDRLQSSRTPQGVPQVAEQQGGASAPTQHPNHTRPYKRSAFRGLLRMYFRIACNSVETNGTPVVLCRYPGWQSMHPLLGRARCKPVPCMGLGLVTK